MGAGEGVELGAGDGCGVGFCDGADVGSSVGTGLGRGNGTTVGAGDGSGVGADEGLEVGDVCLRRCVRACFPDGWSVMAESDRQSICEAAGVSYVGPYRTFPDIPGQYRTLFPDSIGH